MSSDVRWNVYYNVGFGKMGRAVDLVSSSRGREARRVPQKMDPRLRGDDKWVRGAQVGRASTGVAVFVMGETRPRICGVKTVQWTVFRVERPRTLARAGRRCGRGGVVGRGVGRRSELGQAPTYGWVRPNSEIKSRSECEPTSWHFETMYSFISLTFLLGQTTGLRISCPKA